ncbi:asparagine synthase (glutamine-hydrolyzing) [Algoriphagus lutimaris]|uniref:asparagine synthase (glutamine-hydrolyzing) n=1 Tax=Algoriphagus lutimaris TaxID=613197 RepID=UPI00196B2017|nr:asparagine synthase (glutamine-hydrolyzing) [Algoriphagus lutimaris]MBN3518712.1 asparagine synthase (glutamine-hydrolyzing) [Algoriphagus lutimaris]
MCGIAGTVGLGSNVEDVKNMCKSMLHRGPDNTGIWEDQENCVLGHNRLSIIDLSDEANQPFLSASQRYVLVFNGEIYNYIELRDQLEIKNFRTKSDTEVLIEAYEKWGKAMLDKLNGMFAFAIWDKKEKKLFAARDRFGVKPYYYAVKEEKLYFASEIPPLFKAGIPKKPNLAIWSSYFISGKYGVGKETFWEGVNSLEPGFILEYKNGQTEVQPWYDFEKRIIEIRNNPITDSKEFLKNLLLDSTKLRFRADVPVGFNLSGGLDSSMLFSLINSQFGSDSNIEAFTFYTGDSRYDELEYVESLLKGSNFKLNPVLLTASEVPNLAQEIAIQQMEPYGGLPTIAYSKLFKDAANKGFKVLLDGQGADESWAGYDYYFNDSNLTLQGVNSSPFRANVLKDDFLIHQSKVSYTPTFEEKLLNLQYRDLFHTKLQRALRFSDRVSMMSSTELREPFLDYRLVEHVFALPLEMKKRNNTQKWLFREIADDFLHNDLRLAPKRPLQTPQREWFGGELKEWVADNALSLDKLSWFNMNELKKEIDKYINGEQDSSFHLWQWVNTALIFSC